MLEGQAPRKGRGTHGPIELQARSNFVLGMKGFKLLINKPVVYSVGSGFASNQLLNVIFIFLLHE